MEVAQISIFLENRTGGLADVFDVLGRNGIDVRASALADMSDFGILRLVVPDPERTWRILKDAGFTVDKTRVVAVEVPDRPAGLLETLLVLKRAGINVEYMYSVARRSAERAVLIFRFDEIGRALEALRAAGVTVLDRLDP